MSKEEASRGDAADAYDLNDEARPAKPPPVLRYRPAAVPRTEASERRRRLLEEWRLKDLWLPVTLVALGAGCRLLLALSHSTDGGARAAVVMVLVAVGTAFNVACMLGGLTLASRLVDLDPSMPVPTVVKLGLIFVAGASAGGFIASLGDFSTAGITTGVHVLILIYWVLFALLFRAGLIETMMSVAIIGVMQAVLNLGVWLY